MSSNGQLWVAVTGKGGAGKSVIAGTLARVLARRGHKVLALDSDPMPGLAFSLGAREPAKPPLQRAAPRKPKWGHWLRPGIGPVRAIERYSTAAPDGVRLLTLGKADTAGLKNIQRSSLAYHAVVNRIHEAKTFQDWALIGDVPAGPRQVGSRFAGFARTYLVVVQPTWQSALAGRRVARVARAVLPDGDVRFIASQTMGPEDRALVEEMVGEPVIADIPRDEAVAEAERQGLAPIDVAEDSDAVRAIKKLADTLSGE